MLKFIDFIILITIVWFGFKGIKKGLIYEVFSILAFLIGAWGALAFSKITEKFLHAQTEIMQMLALGITFFVIVALVFIIGKIVKSGISLIIPEIIDKVAGMLFGGLKVLFVFGIIFYYICSIDVNEKIITPNAKEKMIMFKPAYYVASFLLPKIKETKEVILENKSLHPSDSTKSYH